MNPQETMIDAALDLETISVELEEAATLGSVALDLIPEENSLMNSDVPARGLAGTFKKLSAVIGILIERNQSLSKQVQAISENMQEAGIQTELNPVQVDQDKAGVAA
jgi:hypothetical protein